MIPIIKKQSDKNFKGNVLINFCMLLFVSMFLPLSVFAQQQTAKISGNVITADGQAAAHISVVLSGTKYGAITNAEGKFEFRALPGNYTLVVSAVIYHRVEIPVTIENKRDNHFPDIKIIETSHQLGEVVVTGTRTEKRLSQAPIQTMVITNSEIKKSGAASTIETLQDNIPGLMITPNAMGNNMRIKGLNSRYILILVDGERLVSEGAGGNINFDQIDVSNIKRIEVVNGAVSTLYGSNAVGAVINIITKDPVHKFEGGANLIAESHNTWKTKVDAGFKHNKLSARVDAFGNFSDGFGGDGKTPYAAKYKDAGGGLKFGYKPIENIDINLNARYFRHETFNPKGTMNVIHPLTHTLSAGLNAGYSTPNKRNQLRLSSNFNRYFDLDVLERKNNTTRKDNTVNYWSNRLINTFTLNNKWEFVGGLEHNHEQTFASKTLGATPTTKMLDDFNIFAQTSYKPIVKLDIIAGVRYTYNTQFRSAFTPKLSLMYQLGDFKLRAGTGTAFRAPSIKELYYDFDHQGMFWIYGNPELKPEKGFYNSFSTEYDRKIINASLSFYYNKISEKITQYELITPIGKKELYYKNVSSATLMGVDANISVLFFNQLALKANYNYCNAKNDETGLQIAGNIKHSSTLSLTWNGKIAKSPFSLQFSGRLSSAKIYQQIETDSVGNASINTTHSKPYSVWKITLVKPFYIKQHTIELTGKIDNIFNYKESSFINPGRQFLIGLRYAFK